MKIDLKGSGSLYINIYVRQYKNNNYLNINFQWLNSDECIGRISVRASTNVNNIRS